MGTRGGSAKRAARARGGSAPGAGWAGPGRAAGARAVEARGAGTQSPCPLCPPATAELRPRAELAGKRSPRAGRRAPPIGRRCAGAEASAGSVPSRPSGSAGLSDKLGVSASNEQGDESHGLL